VPDIEAAAVRIRDAALAMVQTADGRVRVEDYLTALAAAAGEAALAAAGFDVENHPLTPGSALFFEPVNAVLTGDPIPAGGAPAGTVWSILLPLAAAIGAPLPDPESLYRHVASTIGDADWGYVATTLPAASQPTVMPLRAAYELRAGIIAAEQAAGGAVEGRHVLVTTALVQAIEQTSAAIDAPTAVRLSCEVLFGMAKTAPMTAAAFAEGAE
jgi:hypothetical protein